MKGKEQKRHDRKQSKMADKSNHIDNYIKLEWAKSPTQKAEIFQLDKDRCKRLHRILCYQYLNVQKM